MIQEYIQAAMAMAHYELIDQPGEPFYGEIPGLQGVLAIGATLEECRRNLQEVLDEWIVLRLRLNLDVPDIDGISMPVLKATA